MRLRRTNFCLEVLIFASALSAQAATPLTTIRVASGLAFPTYVTHAPGDYDRLFILEQRGKIKILKRGQILPTPFLDISTLLALGGEQGLLGMAFHPNFASNGVFFIDYTNTAGDGVVAKYTVSETDPDVANKTGDIILKINHPTYMNHNGGWIEFGPDGYLYVAMGDGGSQGDPNGHGQSTDDLLGNLLRIDVNGDSFPENDLRDYAIPPDNPFVGKDGEDEIWAYGLRNPWRDTFDAKTGDLWIADVGESDWEEINFQPAGSNGGENYGWSCMEGTHCTTFGGCNCDTFQSVPPIFEYPHGTTRCSITGGVVYRGCEIPDLEGTYFFADYCSAQIWSLDYDGMTAHVTDRTAELVPRTPGQVISFISSFGTDAAGEIYICDRAATTGEVYKIVPATGQPVFVNSSPPSNAIDARTPLAKDGVTAVGISQVIFFFDRPTNCSSPEDFTVEQEGVAGPPPQVESIQAVGGNGLVVSLSRPITPKAWTTIRHGPSQSSVRLGSLPADVGGDRLSSPADILDLVDFLNGVGPTLSIWSTDLDRSGETTPADILMLIDLLNGVGNLESYLGATLPD